MTSSPIASRAQVVGEGGERVEFGAVGIEQGEGLAVADPGRVPFRAAQGRGDLGPDPFRGGRGGPLAPAPVRAAGSIRVATSAQSP